MTSTQHLGAVSHSSIRVGVHPPDIPRAPFDPSARCEVPDLFRAAARSGRLSWNRIELAKNASLYTSGDPGESIFILEAGAVKTVTHSRAGKDCLLDIHIKGEMLGECSLNSPCREETAIAMVPAAVLQMPYQALLNCAVAEGWVGSWMQMLVGRLSDRQQIITNMVTANSEWRLAATLLRLSHKLATPTGRGRRIDVRITHQELSEMVGTTRSRIGLFLKSFRKLGLVSGSPDGSLVVNERRLEEYVNNAGCVGWDEL